MTNAYPGKSDRQIKVTKKVRFTASKQAWNQDNSMVPGIGHEEGDAPVLRRERTRQYMDVIIKVFPYIAKQLTLHSADTDQLCIRLAKTPARHNNGSYSDAWSTAVIDPARKLQSVLDTLCHELIHREQYATKRLDFGKCEATGEVGQLWMGSHHASRGTTYTSYRNLPWEKEAFDGSFKIMEKAVIDAYKAKKISQKILVNVLSMKTLKKKFPEVIAKLEKKEAK